MFDFKIGDRVRVIGKTKVAEIENIIDETALIRYPNGQKQKIGLCNLLPPLKEDYIQLTPEKFDEAVKSVMYDTAEKVGDTDQLDGVFEIVAAVSSQLKAKLFDGNN